jgi:tetratricopeptide (TPR) repeat protein
MTICRILISTVAVISTTACANPINRATAERYYASAEKAVAAGDLQSAKIGYSRALLNAKLGGMGPAAEAQVARKLGRIHGNLCEPDEAERAFLHVVSSEEQLYGPDSWRTFPARGELAQLFFDIGNYPKAVMYFEKAFAVGEKLLTEKHPLGFADLLDDYATALEGTGNTTAAQDARARAAALREKGGPQGAVRSRSDYKPYPRTCK